jgi:hypothetical protein
VNSLPLEYTPTALAELADVAPALRPAVREHLSRLSANHSTCSRRTAFPHPEGWETGLWLRHASGATLVRVSFLLEVAPDRILVRRVILTTEPRLPDWVMRPDEWGNRTPWPVMDV